MKKQQNWQRLHNQPPLWRPFQVREAVIDAIRTFFKASDFLEVETPLLVQVPSTETYLDFFSTELHTAEGEQRTGFLTTSPEYAMKKLLAAGLPRIFQICKSFRNGEGNSRFHNPEFSILEWYRTEADYTDIMHDSEELFLFILEYLADWKKEKWGETTSPDQLLQLPYQGRVFDLTAPWPRLSVGEAFEQYAGITLDELLDEKTLRTQYLAKGYQATDNLTWEQMYNHIFLSEVEPRLAEFDRPVFLYDYPVAQAALSKRKASDPRVAERFELYLGGVELGNAFSELIDAKEQEERLRADVALRIAENRPPFAVDEELLLALSMGFPPTGGIAVGIDRLAMLFADVASLQDVVFFPVRDVFTLES